MNMIKKRLIVGLFLIGNTFNLWGMRSASGTLQLQQQLSALKSTLGELSKKSGELQTKLAALGAKLSPKESGLKWAWKHPIAALIAVGGSAAVVLAGYAGYKWATEASPEKQVSLAEDPKTSTIVGVSQWQARGLRELDQALLQQNVTEPERVQKVKTQMEQYQEANAAEIEREITQRLEATCYRLDKKQPEELRAYGAEILKEITESTTRGVARIKFMVKQREKLEAKINELTGKRAGSLQKRREAIAYVTDLTINLKNPAAVEKMGLDADYAKKLQKFITEQNSQEINPNLPWVTKAENIKAKKEELQRAREKARDDEATRQAVKKQAENIRQATHACNGDPKKCQQMTPEIARAITVFIAGLKELPQEGRAAAVVQKYKELGGQPLP